MHGIAYQAHGVMLTIDSLGQLLAWDKRSASSKPAKTMAIDPMSVIKCHC